MASKKSGLRWSSLIPQLFVLIILPLTLLVLVIAFGSTRLHAQAMRDMAGEQGLRAVRATAAAISDQIHHREQSLQSLALRAGDGVSQATVLTTSDYLLNDFDGGVAFYDRDGKLLAASDHYQLDQTAPEQVDPILRSLPLLAQTPAIFSPDLVRPNDQSDPLYVFAARVRPDLEILGAFSPSRVARQAIGSIYTGTEATVVLVNANHQILYQNGDLGEGVDLASRPGFADALRGDSGITYLQGSPGEVVVAFTPVGTLGWGLVTEEPWQAIASPFLRTTQTAPLVLVPVLLLALIALWFATSQIIQPLRRLEAQTAGLDVGRFEQLEEPVGGIAEIRNLQLALGQMGRRVQAAQKTLRSYIGAITRGQEDERRRLARELHDDTLQSIIALNQRVQLARRGLERHPAGKSLAEIHTLSEGAVANLRRLMRGLRPVYLEELGLSAALEMLAREAGEKTHIPVHFQISGEQRRLAPDIELALYRMAQEALSNVARHANASQAWVDIDFLPGELCLAVRDDGQGFQIPETAGEFAQAGHFGLLGLYERAELIGAHLIIESTPGNGTNVSIKREDSES